MSYSLFTDNRKVTFIIITLWTVLILFGLISIFPPDLLLKMSDIGKISEASDLKHEADRYLHAGEYNKAAGIYEYVLELCPEMEGAISNLGTAYSRSGRSQDAINIFEALLEKKPKREDILYHNLAEIHEKRGTLGKAIRYYLKAAESAPYPENSYQKLGELLMQRKKFDKAILAFNESLNHKSNLYNSYLGMLKHDLLFFNEEAEDYKAIKKQIENIQELNLSIYDSLIFNDLLLRDKGIAKVMNNLGYCNAMFSESLEAEKFFQMAIDIWPEFSDAKNNLKAIRQNSTSYPNNQ